ncbi:MAG: hypothetical protein HY747_09950, partial [Elusimicrobia bacterium]|nr:hypothetical protein [Elusimicrobiota bacterium]
GTTSSAFVLQLADFYGNITPNPLAGDISFMGKSDSTGTVYFTWPDPGANPKQMPAPDTFVSDISRITPGQSTGTFYLYDTIVRVSSLTIDSPQSDGWGVAVQTYSVVPGVPVKLEYMMPPRRLVAGATVQYQIINDNGTPNNPADDPRSPDPAPITVVLKDVFGNITSGTGPVNVDFYSSGALPYPSYTLRAGLDPSKTVQDSSDWALIGQGYNPMTVSISPGQSQATVYIWDTRAGTTTVRTRAITWDNKQLPYADQDQVITPAKAHHFTLHHDFTPSKPLRVGQTGFFACNVQNECGLRVRDLYGNIAWGDQVNGQYYTGTVLFAHTGTSTTVTLVDNLSNSTYYTFSAVQPNVNQPNPGEYRALRISDSIQENLKVFASDYATINLPATDPNKIFGYTNDLDREIAVPRSDGDVVTGGVVVVPQDWAPEPNNTYKQAQTYVGSQILGRTKIFQGDGNTESMFFPIPMLRLNFAVQPLGLSLTARLRTLKVKKLGNLDHSDATQMGLYWDGAGGDGIFRGEDSFGGTPRDALISTGVWSDGEGGWTFDSLDTLAPLAANLGTGSKMFFLAVRISSTAATPKTLGLELGSPSSVILSPDSQAGVSANNFTIRSATSPVDRAPATIQLKYDQNDPEDNIAAFYKGSTDDFAVSHATVPQGEARAGMVRLAMWTKELTATLNNIRVIRIGDGADSHIKSVRLFLDQEDEHPEQGNKKFDQGKDWEITNWQAPVTFDTGYVVLDIVNKPLHGLIDTTTRYFFISYELNQSALAGSSNGLAIGPQDIHPLEGTMAPYPNIQSSNVTTVPTTDEMRVRDVNRPVPGVEVINSQVYQGDVSTAVMKLTLGAQQNTVVWQGLKLDRWSHSSQGGLKANKPDDVKKITIYWDKDNNGLFSATTDQLVIDSARTYTFPKAALITAIGEYDNTVQVNNIMLFFPSDDPFSIDAPGRLVLGDDRTDGVKEVVTYAGVERELNLFTGVSRGQEGTARMSWSTGTVVSGQARVRIKGVVEGLGGEEIVTDDKNYFVVYDVDYLANVHSQARLGAEIRSPDYFSVISPDWVGNTNNMIGLPSAVPPGKSVSYLTTVREYGDKVTVVSSGTALSIEPVQASVDNPMAVMRLSVDKADAVWRGMIVKATGTAAANGVFNEEVSLVKIWKDNPLAGRQGIFEVNDVLVGSGTFGSAGQSLEAPVKFSQANFQRIMTTPQIYFITYNISDNAVPLDPDTKEARTVGARFDQDSFPQYINDIDDPLSDWISEPNILASTQPFTGNRHRLKASPRDVTVTPFPLFTSASSRFSPNKQLTAAAGAAEDTVFLTDTIDLAQCGIVKIQSEIMAYSGINAASILNVQRGFYGSEAAAHSSSTVLEPYTAVFDAPVLSGPLNESATVIGLSNAAGFAPCGYATISRADVAEIVYYAAVSANPVALTGVRRGQFGRNATSHLQGETVTPAITQGDQKMAVLKFWARSSGYEVPWTRALISRVDAAGLNDRDTDSNEVAIFKDNGDGVLNRVLNAEAIGEVAPFTDTLLGTGRFGDPRSGEAAINLSENEGRQLFTIIGTNISTYFMVLSVDPASLFSHEATANKNEVLGAKLSDMIFDGAHRKTFETEPITQVFAITPTVDELIIEDLAVNQAEEAQTKTNAQVMRLTMRANHNTVILDSLTADLYSDGGGVGSDIAAIKVWKNSGAEAFDESDTTMTAGGVYPNLLTGGGDTFVEGKGVLNFVTPLVVGTDPIQLFITYDISEFAAPGHRVGLKISTAGYFGAEIPDKVKAAAGRNLPMSSGLITIKEIESRVTMGVYDAAYDLLGQGGVFQAQAMVPIMRFNMKTDIANAKWQSLTVERIGSSRDPLKTQGSNRDVKFVKIYSDINSNDTLDSNDLVISSTKTISFNVISSSAAVPFNLVVASTQNWPATGWVMVSDIELMRYTAIEPDAGTGRPALRIADRSLRLGDSNTPAIAHSSGMPVEKVD